MGKTSLVREFRERLPAATAFRLGRCLSYGRSVTYSALADVLRQELGLRQEDSAEHALERLAGREILGLTLGLDVAGDLDPRAALLQLQDEWVRADLASSARGGLRCVVIEDLHWAAEPLVEVLERVLSDAEGPVLVLATMRPERAAFPAADTLSLERLADEEVTELIEAALAAPARAARTGAGRRPRGGKPVLRRGGARGPPRQRAARAEDRRLVAARRRRSISASRTPFRASSPPASTCCRPRRKRRSRPRR